MFVEDMAHWPFKVVDNGGAPFIQVVYQGEDKTFSPQEISAMVLTKMREIAEMKIGKPVSKAVVTVPVCTLSLPCRLVALTPTTRT